MLLADLKPIVWAISAMTAFGMQPNPAMLESIFEEALARRQEQYGTFDPRTAQAARDLGLFLARQGQTPLARNLLDQVVRIDTKLFGLAAPQTLADVAELAGVSAPDEAKPLWLRASQSADPATAARALAELGRLHVLSGDAKEAANLYRRAIAKEEIASGRSSPTVALDLNALAKLSQTAEAIPLLERALAIDRQALGSRHAETATTAANLAGLLADTPRNAEAIRLAREALTIFQQTVGPDHRRTAVAASILGYALEAKGDRRGAEEMYRLALRIDQRVLGGADPATMNDAWVLDEFLKSGSRRR